MSFCTAVNCMDGRVQIPVIRYLQQRFDVEYVDSITEAAPNQILSGDRNTAAVQSVLSRLRISVENHNSMGVAIAGHHDCAANTASQSEQEAQIDEAKQFVSQLYDGVEVIGLWVDHNWEVHELNGE